MELELAILQSMVLPQNEKHKLPIGLRILNEGNLKFLHFNFHLVLTLLNKRIKQYLNVELFARFR